MIDELQATAKQIADEIIGISSALEGKTSKWSGVSERPSGLGVTECVGFINDETATSGLSLVVDVWAPADKDHATLRTWCIGSKLDENQVVRFNNIQFDFAADYVKARQLARKGNDVTRDDIRDLLHDQSTQLKRAIVSSGSGFNETTRERFGERYDLSLGEAGGREEIAARIVNVLPVVLSVLRDDATLEAADFIK